MTLNFVNTMHAGDVLVTSTKLAAPQLSFEDEAGVPTANVLVAGVILNTDGKVVNSFDEATDRASEVRGGHGSMLRIFTTRATSQ